MRKDRFASENLIRMEKRLQTSSVNGLSECDVAERQKQFGKNEVLPKKKKVFWQLLERLFSSGSLPLAVLCLAVAGCFSWLTAVWLGASYLVYASVVLLLLVYRNREGATLAKKLLPFVRVVRDGKVRTLSPEDLVIGDLLLLQAGDILYTYAHVISDAPIKVIGERGGEKKLLVKHGEACFDTHEESNNFLAPGDVVREGEASAFVTEYTDRSFGADISSGTTSAQASLCRVATRAALVLVLLLLGTTVIRVATGASHMLLWKALSVSAVLLSISPALFIELICDVIFLSANKSIYREEEAFLADLSAAERLSEVDTFVLSTQSVCRSSRYVVKNFITGTGKRFAPKGKATPFELQEVSAALLKIHEREPFGVEERGVVSYCAKHQGDLMNLTLRSILSEKGYSLASFKDIKGGRIFSLLGGDPEWLVREAAYVSVEGKVRAIDSKTKEILLTQIKKYRVGGYHLVGYAETQTKAVPNDVAPVFFDMCLLGVLVFAEVPDAKISGTLKALEAEGKKVFFMHEGEDPSWIKKEVSLLKNVPVVDGNSPSFAEEIETYVKNPDIPFCIGVHFSPLQKSHVVHLLETAGHKVAVAGKGFDDHRMLCAAGVGFVPLPEKRGGVSPIVYAGGTIHAKEHIYSQVASVKKAIRLLGAFGVTTAYLCASLVCRATVATVGFLFGIPLLSAEWFALFATVLDFLAVILLSRCRTSETHHFRDTLAKAREQSGSFFIGAFVGALFAGGISVWVAVAPARFGFSPDAFLLVAFLLLLNVGLWRFSYTKGLTAIWTYSALSVLLVVLYFLTGHLSSGVYGAPFVPVLFFWALIPVGITIFVGTGIMRFIANQRSIAKENDYE